METSRTVTSIVDNEALEYAMYTLQNRALPSLVDGFKPVHRYVMTMALKTAKTEFNKVAAIGGSVSSLGYNHGEVSAQDACKLLAANWSNNVPFLQGRGNFGSRLVNQSAASRYVYAKIHENFTNLYKDFDILPENPDPEQKVPLWYLPTIPTVLLNGMEGIATGFATKILPYSLRDIKRCCAEILSEKTLTPLVPTFPQFSGEVTRDGTVVTMKGIHKLTGYSLKITEVPIGFDREKYIILLDKLEEDGKLVSYLDQCDENGFNFTIKLKRNLKWTDANVVKMFRLEKTITESLSVLDENGKFKLFDCPEDLVNYFINFKMVILDTRIKSSILATKKLIDFAANRVKWIAENISGNIEYVKVTKAELEKYITEKYGKDFVSNLMSMNIYHMSTDELKKLEVELARLQELLLYWKKQTPRMQFISDLKN